MLGADVLDVFTGKPGHAITFDNPASNRTIGCHYGSSAASDDISDARVYGGIHFREPTRTQEPRLGRAVGSSLQRHLRVVHGMTHMMDWYRLNIRDAPAISMSRGSVIWGQVLPKGVTAQVSP